MPFIQSQLSYCPLILMLHSRRSNNLKNHLHKRTLGLVGDQTSTFEELLAKDRTVTTHVKNLQLLVTKIYNAKNDLLTLNVQQICVERSLR